jgi:hypothetical protein
MKEQAKGIKAHTPGPWTLTTVLTQVGHCHKIGPFPSRGAHSETFACVYVDGLGLRAEDSPELLANARLIAAAPELVAAILERCEYHHIPLNEGGWAHSVSERFNERRTVKCRLTEAERAALQKAGIGGEK